jgi:hypothetical protein
MDRLDRSIGIYMIELSDGRIEQKPDATAEDHALRALGLR